MLKNTFFYACFSILSIITHTSCNSEEANQKTKSNPQSELQQKEGESTKNLPFQLIRTPKYFITSVETLRLREAPSLESKVIGSLPKGVIIYNLRETSNQKDTIKIGGKSVIDYWYKVNVGYYDKDCWIFGGGIADIKEQELSEFIFHQKVEKKFLKSRGIENFTDSEIDSLLYYEIQKNYTLLSNSQTKNTEITFWNLLTSTWSDYTSDYGNLYRNKYNWFPVYETENGDLSILIEDFFLSTELRDKENNYQDLFRKRNLIYNDYEDKKVEFPILQEKILAQNHQVYLYTNQRIIPVSIKNYIEHDGTCSYYSEMILDIKPLRNGETPLFVAANKNEVDYQVSESIKEKFTRHLKFDLFYKDCPDNNIDRKVIAQLTNTNLYFVGNSRRGLAEINTLDRDIYYISNDFTFRVFGHNIDYFGCSCL